MFGNAYDISYTDEGWLWDPFNFENGYVQSIKNIPISAGATQNLVVINRIENYIPIILTSATGLRVRWNNNWYTLNKGTNIISEIKLAVGENTLRFNNTSTAKVLVTVDIRGGRL